MREALAGVRKVVLVRVPRMKVSNRSCYYHIMNRLSGPLDEYPLDDVDKEFAFELFRSLMGYYLIEPISMVWLGNHWHVVLHVGTELPSKEAIAERHNDYYGNTRPRVGANDTGRCREIGEEMLDISSMIGVFQQKFSVFYNKTHHRRGRLWADRFKSVILDGENALWTCVKYVELNPVRAGLSKESADYRFCTWGRYCGSGSHPFGNNFVKHMKRSLGEIGSKLSDDDVLQIFKSELARTQAVEAGVVGDELEDVIKDAKKPDRMSVRFLRRTRHWTDGAILGTQSFVREIASLFHDKKQVMKKRLSEGTDADGRSLTCFRVLRQTRT
jgi:putative transposase